MNIEDVVGFFKRSLVPVLSFVVDKVIGGGGDGICEWDREG